MLVDDERRTHVSRDEAERVRDAVERLKHLSNVAIDFQQMDLRSNASIELFGVGFLVRMESSITQAVRSGECPMTTIVNQPKIKELLEAELSYHPDHIHLLRRIIPPVGFELMKLSMRQLDELETLQNNQSSMLHKDGSIWPLYLARGGRPDFQGGLSWGLVDHNASDVSFNHRTEELLYLIRLATTLPHVRYEYIFKGHLNGIASISQQLIINPRVAFIPTGFNQWFRHLRPLKGISDRGITQNR